MPVTTVTDTNTIPLAEAISDQIFQLLGERPYVIRSILDRLKLDPNREINEAACGNAEAEQAWHDYHNAIADAKLAIGRGILFDIHGQNHGYNSTELGYLLSSDDLNAGDYDTSRSSINLLASENAAMTGDDLMIGPESFGAYLENEGFKAVPSPRENSPGSHDYFSGGYITKTYGSKNGGLVDAIQCETPYEIRSNGPLRDDFGIGLGNAIVQYRNRYIGLN